MQNPYVMERFVQEHNAHARAVAELQALRRQALAARRRRMLDGWLSRLEGLFAPSRESGSRHERRESVTRSSPAELPLAQARR